MSQAPEHYPKTHVYVNKLGIRDAKKLDAAEADLTAIRSLTYLQSSADLTFDTAHLQAIHTHLFQDLYTWAGAFRTYDMRRGDCTFTPAEELARYSRQVFDDLAVEDWLEQTTARDMPSRLAHYYDLLNRLHPFPDGNGRTQRLFITDLAAHNGFDVAWELVYRWEIEEVAVQSFYGRIEPTFALFERITRTIGRTLDRKGR